MVQFAKGIRTLNEQHQKKTHESEQVSFVIHHTIKPGRHDAYEAWLKRIIPEAAQFPGHMGTHVARPSGNSHLYEIVVRFASHEDALHWVGSETRSNLMLELTDCLASPENVDIQSGIDYWFTPVTNAHRPPRRWKQWLITVSVIWPLSMAVPLLVGPVFQTVPLLDVFPIKTLVNAMFIVALVIYVVMPPYTRAIAKWLSR